ncbi:MAG TPA: hypothetical protein DCP51_00385 [Clostridiales bacterium]|nr:MAG: hypothetical protein A2X42_04100 [Candidatus Margulisbacteria bacterium GWF2_38_17]OGI07167.1 MAG: hypothetical protein A2X41_06170 [Candidatus Margulisbacteria bacterium GWE2_39_32]HAN20131.1 hypothetical protein [Clostridiales bacterium]HCT84718.1 hypothetical protein [Candidatus Margulisiibacteriota bacterium]
MQQEKINVLFGKHLAKLRQAKGLTLEKLAYENDLSKSTISRIERGLVDVKLSTLAKIAEGLDISLDELMKVQ